LSRQNDTFGAVTHLALCDRLSVISDTPETQLRITGEQTHKIHDVSAQYHEVLAATAAILFAAAAQLNYVAEYAVCNNLLHIL
jgi:hypothetical protein